jgi:hypothetical protein
MELIIPFGGWTNWSKQFALTVNFILRLVLCKTLPWQRADKNAHQSKQTLSWKSIVQVHMKASSNVV